MLGRSGNTVEEEQPEETVICTISTCFVTSFQPPSSGASPHCVFCGLDTSGEDGVLLSAFEVECASLCLRGMFLSPGDGAELRALGWDAGEVLSCPRGVASAATLVVSILVAL